MKRVLIVMPVWGATTEVWLRRMAKALGSAVVAMACEAVRGVPDWPAGVRGICLRPGVGRVSRFLRRSGFYTEAWERERTLSRLIRREGITDVLCHYGTLGLEFSKVWGALPVNVYVHFHGYDATFDLRSHEHPERAQHPAEYASGVRALADRAVLIANSKFTRSLLEGIGIPEDRIRVKYLGAPLPESEPGVVRKREWVHIVHVGRLVDFKSPDRTICAFERARAMGLQGRLTIAGDGPLRAMCELLRAKSVHKDSITIRGEISPDQASQLFSEADIFTQHNIKGELTGQEECLGVSVLEAMGWGVPVVGTRSGGVRETVVEEDTGILGEPGDVEGQARGLYRLGTDAELRRRMGLAGRERVRTQFSLEKESQVLRSILGIL